LDRAFIGLAQDSLDRSPEDICSVLEYRSFASRGFRHKATVGRSEFFGGRGHSFQSTSTYHLDPGSTATIGRGEAEEPIRDFSMSTSQRKQE
jgi:hypothetical protein